jgi:hypothetical protein
VADKQRSASLVEIVLDQIDSGPFPLLYQHSNARDRGPPTGSIACLGRAKATRPSPRRVRLVPQGARRSERAGYRDHARKRERPSGPRRTVWGRLNLWPGTARATGIRHRRRGYSRGHGLDLRRALAGEGARPSGARGRVAVGNRRQRRSTPVQWRVLGTAEIRGAALTIGDLRRCAN